MDKSFLVGENPIEKLLKRGPTALTDAELLAIFLRTGTKGKTAVDQAQELLAAFGSWKALLGADQKDFTAVSGLGGAKYAQIHAGLEMVKRHYQEVIERGNALTSPDITRAYLSAQLRSYSYEVFVCLFLDNQHRVIKFEELFVGSISGASVYPREVVKKALYYNASCCILGHNHPSGINEPSMADKQITEKLKQALSLVDISILDHFIVGDGQPYSFAEHGLI
jgi:DNA repair protein RadC